MAKTPKVRPIAAAPRTSYGVGVGLNIVSDTGQSLGSTGRSIPIGTPITQSTALAAARARGLPQSALSGIVSIKHPRYIEWASVWTELGHVYEGDGPYLSGEALVPHPRELNFKQNTDGSTDYTVVVSRKRKYLQRQQIARYENFAATITDLFVDYQYAKLPKREVTNQPALLDRSPYLEWLEDVDGYGTHMDDWLKRWQTLTNVYGHQAIVVDRQPPNTLRTNITPNGGKTGLTTLAQLGRPVLRCYSPLDIPDWLAPRNQLAAIKVEEPVERASLLDQPLPAERWYFTWNGQYATQFDTFGAQVQVRPHGFGELPVRLWYCKRRARIPIIGRGLLGDGRLFKDHFNLISELREIFRAQTFNILNIPLQDDETVQDARNRMGEHVGTDSVVFTKGGQAIYVAPGDGPAARYTEELARVERKAFRLTSLPWESDSKEAEAEGSRQLKAADLNSSLASLADNAEEIDYFAARMYFQGTLGPERGLAAYKAAGIRIAHPDEFHVEQLLAKAEETKLVLELGVGPTAAKLLKAGVLQLALPDLDQTTRDTIEKELEAESTLAQQAQDKERQDLIAGRNPREQEDREDEKETIKAEREDVRAQEDRDHQERLARVRVRQAPSRKPKTAKRK
jgi:hypothetical protein